MPPSTRKTLNYFMNSKDFLCIAAVVFETFQKMRCRRVLTREGGLGHWVANYQRKAHLLVMAILPQHIEILGKMLRDWRIPPGLVL